MRCSFAHGNAFFSQKTLAEGSGLAPYAGKERDGSMRKEEGAIVTSATAAQCVDEGGGWWVVYISRNAGLDSPSIVACMSYSRTHLVRFMAVEGSN